MDFHAGEEILTVARGRNRLRWASAIVALLVAAAPGAPAGRNPAADPLSLLLTRAGRLVEEFADQISRVRCSEGVTQRRMGKNGKIDFQQQTLYDALVLVHVNGNQLTVEEVRDPQRQTPNPNHLPLLVTNGFSTLALIFHPYYQAGFEFTLLDDEEVAGRHCRKVGFRHLEGTPTPTALRVRGHDYPLDMTGTAWLEAETGATVRIDAGLSAPMDDINLRLFTSDVQYEPVQFAGEETAYWLPSVAKIDVESPLQHWQNIHEFRNYRLYSVSIQVVPQKP